MRINDITQKLGVEVVADAITLRELGASKWFITSESDCLFVRKPEKVVKLICHSEELGNLELTINSFNEEQITNLNHILKTFNKGNFNV